ncbi:hypothetical protein MTP99_012179 [Tenebrio molitor]|nr:hypothetical protein MTP99_012179 [Tenebrio molitor]
MARSGGERPHFCLGSAPVFPPLDFLPAKHVYKWNLVQTVAHGGTRQVPLSTSLKSASNFEMQIRRKTFNKEAEDRVGARHLSEKGRMIQFLAVSGGATHTPVTLE